MKYRRDWRCRSHTHCLSPARRPSPCGCSTTPSSRRTSSWLVCCCSRVRDYALRSSSTFKRHGLLSRLTVSLVTSLELEFWSRHPVCSILCSLVGRIWRCKFQRLALLKRRRWYTVQRKELLRALQSLSRCNWRTSLLCTESESQARPNLSKTDS